jgi:hypothetical protein
MHSATASTYGGMDDCMLFRSRCTKCSRCLFMETREVVTLRAGACLAPWPSPAHMSVCIPREIRRSHIKINGTAQIGGYCSCWMGRHNHQVPSDPHHSSAAARRRQRPASYVVRERCDLLSFRWPNLHSLVCGEGVWHCGLLVEVPLGACWLSLWTELPCLSRNMRRFITLVVKIAEQATRQSIRCRTPSAPRPNGAGCTRLRRYTALSARICSHVSCGGGFRRGDRVVWW